MKTFDKLQPKIRYLRGFSAPVVKVGLDRKQHPLPCPRETTSGSTIGSCPFDSLMFLAFKLSSSLPSLKPGPSAAQRGGKQYEGGTSVHLVQGASEATSGDGLWRKCNTLAGSGTAAQPAEAAIVVT